MKASQGRHARAARMAAVAAASVISTLAVMPGVANASPHNPPTPDQPCGVSQKDASTKFDHVVFILMENKPLAQVEGSPDAPYMNKLAGLCGTGHNDHGPTHPSLPNYIKLTSGSDQGITDDANPSAHPLNVDSIFSQLNGDWRGLDESMNTNCEQQNDGHYAVRHNPATYYVKDNFQSVCQQKDIPFALGAHTTPDLSAKFTFITPDECDDMHTACAGGGASEEVQTGDKYLSTLIPALINTKEYQAGNTAIFITFDEGAGANNSVLTEVIAPTVTPGTKANDPFTDYSLLRTAEDELGLPPLGAAATATSMRDAFNI
jgi:phosphatidylinositol-3-phosphatase